MNIISYIHKHHILIPISNLRLISLCIMIIPYNHYICIDPTNVLFQQAATDGATGSDQALKLKIAELMSENKQVKEALLVATSGQNTVAARKHEVSVLDQEMQRAKLKSANEENERMVLEMKGLRQELRDTQCEVGDKETQILGLRAQLSGATSRPGSPRSAGSKKGSPRTPDSRGVYVEDPLSPSTVHLNSADASEIFDSCSDITVLLSTVLQHYFSIIEDAIGRDRTGRHEEKHKHVKKLVQNRWVVVFRGLWLRPVELYSILVVHKMV